ncbi:Dihydroxyacetone phosphatase [Streptomyces tanashiensis]
MATDILAGLEAGMQTFLVRTGLTTQAEIDRVPFRPSKIVPSIADIVDRPRASGTASIPCGSGSTDPR